MYRANVEFNFIVILGADSVLYGASVVRDFQRNGFIVIASVASGEAADALERDTEGYVRALVLDAEEVRLTLRRKMFPDADRNT